MKKLLCISNFFLDKGVCVRGQKTANIKTTRRTVL